MKITKTKHGNSLCLALKGRIDTTIVPELEKLLKELLHGVADLTIDLREMDYLSSDGLRVFADAQKTMNKQGFMRVIHVNDKIMKIFEVNGFVDILTVFSGTGERRGRGTASRGDCRTSQTVLFLYRGRKL